MKHKPLFWVDKGPEYDPYLTDVPDRPNVKPAKPSSLTVDDVAGMLDQDEENDNYHELVGSYTGLSMVLRCVLKDEKKVLEIMRCLVDEGGFRGLKTGDRR